jgi:hypothetical protein
LGTSGFDLFKEMIKDEYKDGIEAEKVMKKDRL